MPTMTPETFLGLADRLAAQYQLTLNYAATLNPAATRAVLTIDPLGNNNSLTFTAKNAGFLGNSISLRYKNPGSANQPLTVTVTGYDIVVSLATDNGSLVTTTANDIKSAIEASLTADPLVIVTNNDAGTGIVTDYPKTFLAGGLHGLYRQQVLETGDIDVINDLSTQAQILDTQFQPDVIFGHVPLWGAFITVLANHFTDTGQSGGIDGFLSANDIRVHEYFDRLYHISTGIHLSGRNVFRAVPKQVALITVQGTAFANLTLISTTGYAEKTIQTAPNTALLYRANAPGLSGNAINVTYVVGVGPNQPLYVEVQGKDITVHLGTNNAGVVNSTAQQVMDAVNLHWLSSTLVTVTAPGAVTGTVEVFPRTNLLNYNNAILYTSKVRGSLGQEISIEYKDPAANNQPLSVTVTGTAIRVDLATDSTGKITSTGQLIQQAISGSLEASRLVTAITQGDASGRVGAVAATKLIGGNTALLTEEDPLGNGSGEANPTNLAAQQLRILVSPASKEASLALHPENSLAFAVVDPVGPNNTVRYDALRVKYDDYQRIIITNATGGTFILSLGADTTPALNYNTTAANIQSKLEALASIGAGNVAVSGPAGGPWLVHFQGALAETDVSQLGIAPNLLQGTNEVQHIELQGGPTGGTFTLSYVGVSTVPLAITATGADLQNALTSLSSVGAGNVAVSGPAGGPWDVTFQGNLGNRDTQLIVGNGSNLTGGTNSVVAVIVTTEGQTPNAMITTAMHGGRSGESISVGYIYLQQPNLTTQVQVLDGKISVILATNANSAIIETAAGIISAINSDSIASELVVASPIGLDSGLIGGSPPPPPVSLNSHRTSIVYSANSIGTTGNTITIEYADPGVNNAPLTVNVIGNSIRIDLATDNTGKVVSTAADIISAVNANPDAAVLVTAEPLAQVDGIVAAVPPTPLEGGAGPNLLRSTTLELTLVDTRGISVTRGIVIPAGLAPGAIISFGASYATKNISPGGVGNNSLLFTAVQGGESGNNITIEYADPVQSNAPLSINVFNNAIKINLATDYTGRIVSTADEIKAAVNADPVASSLVRAANIGAGFGYVGIVLPTNLAGGLNSQRFYAVESVSVVNGGQEGDEFAVEQVVERQISL